MSSSALKILRRSALMLLLLAPMAVLYAQGPEALFARAMQLAALAEQYPLLILALYLLRLAFLVPVSVLILLTGLLYGPWWGQLIAVTGLMLGGTVEFLLARRLGRPLGELSDQLHWLKALRGRIRDKPFQTILLLRLAFVPFDPVNLLAAWARAPLRHFAAASVLGLIPTTFPIVTAGASVNLAAWRASGKLWPGVGGIAWPQLALSLGLIALTLVVSAALRRRAAAVAAQG